MERDKLPGTPPESPAGGGDKKESKRKRRRRAPSHVPLHIQPEVAERSQPESSDQKPEQKPEKKSRRKRKKKPEATKEAKHETQESGDVKPVNAENSDEAPKVADSSKEQSDRPRLRKKAEKAAETPEADTAGAEAIAGTTREIDEPESESETLKDKNEEVFAEIPLDQQEVEEEVFVSERWRQQNEQPKEKPKQKASRTNAETQTPNAHVVATEQTQARTPERQPFTDLTASLRELSPFHRSQQSQAAEQQRTVEGDDDTPAHELTAAAAGLSPVRVPQENIRSINRFHERRHNTRALITGMLVGGVIEHLRHKRREKRMETAHRRDMKAVRTSQEATNIRLREAENKVEQADRRQTVLERQIERLQKAPKESMAIPLTAATPEKSTPSPAAKKPERPATVAAAEKSKATHGLSEAEEAIKKAQEAVERAHRDLEEQPELPPDRKVETSAWHRIEVDKKTGKAVENPTLAYGEEFQHEQHPEQLRKVVDETGTSGDHTREQYTAFQTLPTPATTSAGSKKALPEGPVSAKDRAIQAARTTLQKADPVDVGLWIVLGIVILLIIAAL